MSTMRRTPERTFQRTHPWLTFATIDLQGAPYRLWMDLGEARSGIERLAGTPLHPDVAADLDTTYLVRGLHATSAIEGSTLTEDQVHARLAGRLDLPRSQEYLGREVDNMHAGFRHAQRRGFEEGARLSADEIGELNRLILDGLDLAEDAVAGRYRQRRVVVGRYLGAPPEDVEHLVERLCLWLSGPDFRTDDRDLATAFAVIAAITAHVYLAWIHPFGDGNGRTARLVEHRVLVGSGVPTPAAHLLSNHYNLTRTEYYRQLDRTSRSGGDIVPFLLYAVEGFVDQLREQFQLVREQQLDAAWRGFVHQRLDALPGPAQARCRRLVLDLALQPGPVARGHLRDISARVAQEYAGLAGRTLTRDLGGLLEMGLVQRQAGGYLANREPVLAFLPGRFGQVAERASRRPESGEPRST
jgi:Fic family protein